MFEPQFLDKPIFVAGRGGWGRCVAKPNHFAGYTLYPRSSKNKVLDLLKPVSLTDQGEMMEYVSELKRMEKGRAPYRGRSPQISKRLEIMRYISEICSTEAYDDETLVHCIYLYDRFCDEHEIHSTQLCVVALTCIVISAKIHENDSNTPDIRKIVRHLPVIMPNNVKLVVAMEKMILTFFEFKVIIPTEVNFMDIYHCFVLDGFGTPIFYLLYKYENKKAYSGTGAEMMREANALLREVTKSLAMLAPSPADGRYNCSLIAAATLMYVRKRVKLNFWTEQLSNITGHKYEDVLHCANYFVQPILHTNNSTTGGDPIFLNL